MAKYKKSVDILLSMIELNKKKIEIITKLGICELNNQTDSEEYNNLVYYYKIVYDLYEKKLKNFSFDERNHLLVSLINLNYSAAINNNIMRVIRVTSKLLPIYKTMLDLDPTLITLHQQSGYVEQLTPLANDLSPEEIDSILHYLNLPQKSPTTTIDDYNINRYMVSDLTNIIYGTTINKLSKETKDVKRLPLIDLKYKLIFLFSNLETKAMDNNFKLTPTIINEFFIKKTGISIDNYRNEFNQILTNMFMQLQIDLTCDAYSRRDLSTTDLIVLTAVGNNFYSNKELYEKARYELSADNKLPIATLKGLSEINEVLDDIHESFQKKKK